MTELTITNLLLRCKMAYTIEDVKFLILEGLVFINGKVCYDCSYIVSTYDCIQFGLSKAFHLYHRELLSYIKVYYRKLSPYVHARIHFNFRSNKQRKNVNAD